MGIRVAVIDRQPIYRVGLCATITSAPSCDLVGSGESHTEAVELARQQRPEIMLLDMQLESGGIETLKSLASECRSTKYIMLSSQPSEDDLSASFEAGAKGYVVKHSVNSEQLVSIVGSVHAGLMYTEPSFASALLSRRFSQQNADTGPLWTLTVREKEILRSVTLGRTNKEIALGFGLSEKTVKHHMTRILSKLQARNRVEAAMIGRDRFGFATGPAADGDDHDPIVRRIAFGSR